MRPTILGGRYEGDLGANNVAPAPDVESIDPIYSTIRTTYQGNRAVLLRALYRFEEGDRATRRGTIDWHFSSGGGLQLFASRTETDRFDALVGQAGEAGWLILQGKVERR